MTSYLYLMVAVILVSLGQILQKMAAGQLAVGKGPVTVLFSLVRSTWFWLAIVSMGFGLLAWLLALTTIEVSKAYPVLASSYAITTCLSVLVFNEPVSAGRWLGVALISIGAAVMLAF